MDELEPWIASWHRAEARARAAEERVVDAYLQYTQGRGPLPPLLWETNAAMHRAQATERLEHVFQQAKRIRKPTSAEFRQSIPDSIGGPGED
jgi:hypothetical protein